MNLINKIELTGSLQTSPWKYY